MPLLLIIKYLTVPCKSKAPDDFLKDDATLSTRKPRVLPTEGRKAGLGNMHDTCVERAASSKYELVTPN